MERFGRELSGGIEVVKDILYLILIFIDELTSKMLKVLDIGIPKSLKEITQNQDRLTQILQYYPFLLLRDESCFTYGLSFL